MSSDPRRSQAVRAGRASRPRPHSRQFPDFSTDGRIHPFRAEAGQLLKGLQLGFAASPCAVSRAASRTPTTSSPVTRAKFVLTLFERPTAEQPPFYLGNR